MKLNQKMMMNTTMNDLIPKRDVGRPTVMTESVLDKLELLFSLGATDEIACKIANINPATMYNYQQEHPEFVERKEMLKNMPTWQAKANVVEKIMAGDIQQSTWWLERKAKDEFSTRSEHFNANLDVNKLSEEDQERIKQVINENTQPSS